jgi:hypothetical protein
MNAKQTGIILLLLWHAGCAAVDPIDESVPGGATDTVVQKDAQGPVERYQARQATGRIKRVDAEPITTIPPAHETEVLTLVRMLERLDHVTTLESGPVTQQIKALDARFKALNPAGRYELALLLTRKGAGSRSLNRAISILDDLLLHVKDNIVKEILQLHRHYFILQKQYRSERNKTIELTKKIENLKGLEQDLDKSNTRIQESLNPAPGDAK